MKFTVYFIPERNSESNLKMNLKIKSVHKFNDFSSSFVKQELCQKLEEDPDRCILTNLDFQNDSQIYGEDTKMSTVNTEGYSVLHFPTLLVYKLSQPEHQRRTGEWMYIHIRIDKEIRDFQFQHTSSRYSHQRSD